MVRLDNDEKVVSSKKKKRHTEFRTRVQKTYPIKTKMVKIDTLFMPKTAKNHTLSVLWGRTLHCSYKRGSPGSCSTLCLIKLPVLLFCGLLKDSWSFAFSACFESNFYNNCLISRALIGSYLSSIGAQTDIILKLNF